MWRISTIFGWLSNSFRKIEDIILVSDLQNARKISKL